MRRFWLRMLALAGLLAVPGMPTYAAPPQTSAPHAILIEAETGSVLFEKSADALVAPASLAKLMTVDVVFEQLELGNIKLTDAFVISENAWRKGGAMSSGSTMYAALHSRVKVEDLLKGVIIQSANDGCIVLAEGIAGNEASFVRMMNDRARELGLTKSTFTNADRSARSENARDRRANWRMVARHIVTTYPEYYKWFSEREFTWNKIRQQNRNPLLGTVEGADGMKTGFTNEAGYNLVGSATRNGLRLDRRRHRTEERQGPRRRGQEAAGVWLPRVRLPTSCSPRARLSPRPRSMAARRARFRSPPKQQIKLMVPRSVERAHFGEDGLCRTGPRAGAGRAADRPSAGLARRHQGAGSAVAGHRKRSRSGRRRSAPSMPPRNLWSTCSALRPRDYKSDCKSGCKSGYNKRL